MKTQRRIQTFLAGLRLGEQAAPGTPPTGIIVVYPKTDGRLYWKDDAGVEHLVVGGSGGFWPTLSGLLVSSAGGGIEIKERDDLAGGNWTLYADADSFRLWYSSDRVVFGRTNANPALLLPGSVSDQVLAKIQLHASQSVDALQIGPSGSILSRFDKGGRFGTRVNTAPANGDVATSEAIFYFDNTAGAPKIMAKVKDSAGTVFSQGLSTVPEHIGTVEHGTTAGTARPATFGVVLWRGSVRPANAVEGDLLLYYSPTAVGELNTSLWRRGANNARWDHIGGGSVGGGNLEPDSSIEFSQAGIGWNSFFSTSSLGGSADTSRTGVQSLKAVKAGGAAGSMWAMKLDSVDNVPVSEGDAVVASGWFKPESTVRSLKMEIQFLTNRSDSFIAALQTWTGNSVLEKSGEWVQARVAGIAPAGATYARIIYTINAVAASEIHYIDDLVTEKGLIQSPSDFKNTMYRVKTADQSTVSTHTTLVNDNHLKFPIIPRGMYAIEGVLYVFSGATTTGAKVALNGPASPGAVLFSAIGQITQGASGAASNFFGNSVNAYDASTTEGATVVGTSASAPSQIHIKGYVRNGANAGDLVLRIAAEANAVITYMEGSWMKVTPI